LGGIGAVRHRQSAPGRRHAHAGLGHRALLRCWLPREATAALLEPEIERARKARRQDLPQTEEAVANMLAEVRARHGPRGRHRAAGHRGFCVPVFDASGHIVLGLMTLGSLATFDPDYGGAIDAPLQAAARQLSSDLGWRADPNH
jgi:DNA-binding IclR family transcriptional regulator